MPTPKQQAAKRKKQRGNLRLSAMAESARKAAVADKANQDQTSTAQPPGGGDTYMSDGTPSRVRAAAASSALGPSLLTRPRLHSSASSAYDEITPEEAERMPEAAN